MPDDDWGLDDWEDESFDEDVWDHTQLDLEEVAEDVDEPVDDADLTGLGRSGLSERSTGREGLAMGWSAWEVGTIFALGGWLADHHTATTAEQVKSVLAAHASGRDDHASPLGSAHPPPASGYPYDNAQGTLQVGDALDQGVLYAELQAAISNGRHLMIQAESPPGADHALVLIISAVPFSSGPRLWVVAEENPGGFKATRLVPVFAPVDIRAGVFATDHPSEAADAAAWACRREGFPPEALTITERRLTPSTTPGVARPPSPSPG
jgi:hypothetical protein